MMGNRARRTREEGGSGDGSGGGRREGGGRTWWCVEEGAIREASADPVICRTGGRGTGSGAREGKWGISIFGGIVALS